MSPNEIDKLLNENWAKKHFEKIIKRFFPYVKKILTIKIKPIKIYRDRRSFNLAAFYKIKIKDAKGKVRRKTVFAAADSRGNKENDWRIGRLIYNHLSKNSTRVLQMPRPYSFLKSYGLFLREHVQGTILAEAIRKNKGLTPRLARALTESLEEFQSIRISSQKLKKAEKIPNLPDLEKNIRILKKRKHSQLMVIKKEFQKIKNAITQTTDFKNRQPKVLSHGDLNPFNIVLTPKKKIVFLDAGNINLRHPFLDIAGFCSHLETLADLKIGKKARKKSRRLFLEAYLGGEKLTPKEKALFALYERYFRLLAKTHILVWK